jgi:tetratricopeptide (TPR) repeat protein
MIRRRVSIAAVLLLLSATSAFASWYDDYDAGLSAARKGQWSVVADKMSKAIAGNANENNKARTYGAIFINYHPYYYRGIANLNMGRFEQAINDLEKTSGAGELDLGRVEDMIQRAKTKLEADNTPEPTTPPKQTPPVTPPVNNTPPPVTPTAPSIDPALRQRAQGAIGTATQKINAAQQRKATASPQYQQAMTALADARTRVAGARNNGDLEQAIASADNAALYADSAMAPTAATNNPPPVNVPPVTRPTAAVDAVLGDYQVALRKALEAYFAGEFETSTAAFAQLTRKLPTNGWVWAFYGASQYSLGAFELNEQYKKEAMASFRKARQLRTWKGGLPEKYFSKRIRRVFESAG